jgi:ubiquinol-cytochrome c reductase cytochrome c subunit
MIARPRALGPFAVAMVVLMLGTAPAAAQPPVGIVRPTREPTSPSVGLGAQLFAGNCASCHGISGAGISSPRPGSGGILGEGPSLRGVGAQAADLYLRRGYMPLGNPHEQPEDNRVQFSETEIRSLVAFVNSLGSGPAIPSPDPASGSISDGLKLFMDNCAGCHQALAEGGYVTGARVPPLHTVPATQIAEAVRLGPYLMPRFSTAQISDAQLNSIIKYVQSTGAPDNRGGWGIGNLGPIPEGLVTWWLAAPLLILGCLAVSRRVRR